MFSVYHTPSKDIKPSGTFSIEHVVLLDKSLAKPVGLERGGECRDGHYGHLGKLLHMHSPFLAFESFAPSISAVQSHQYVGIELLRWDDRDVMENTTLLIYPGQQVRYLRSRIPYT